MTPKETHEMIANAVNKAIKAEKKKLAEKMKEKLLYTGEFASASDIMEVLNDW